MVDQFSLQIEPVTCNKLLGAALLPGPIKAQARTHLPNKCTKPNQGVRAVQTCGQPSTSLHHKQLCSLTPPSQSVTILAVTRAMLLQKLAASQPRVSKISPKVVDRSQVLTQAVQHPHKHSVAKNRQCVALTQQSQHGGPATPPAPASCRAWGNPELLHKSYLQSIRRVDGAGPSACCSIPARQQHHHLLTSGNVGGECIADLRAGRACCTVGVWAPADWKRCGQLGAVS